MSSDLKEQQTEPASAPRTTRAPGDEARRVVLEQAAVLATIDGLDGLSIGRLAAATDMPKSSLFVLFGSKEELQLATIDAARTSFIAEVVTPALTEAEGLARLAALCERFLSYVERRVFPGGCFFVAVSAEMGARPGQVHDRVSTYQQQWRDLLRDTAREARDRAELPADEDPDQVAFEVGALLAGTNIIVVLHDDNAVIERAREAIRRRLGTR